MEKENLSFTSVKLHTKALQKEERYRWSYQLIQTNSTPPFEEKIFARKPVFFESLVLFLSDRFEKRNEESIQVFRTLRNDRMANHARESR